jgi:hypothetical protein
VFTKKGYGPFFVTALSEKGVVPLFRLQFFTGGSHRMRATTRRVVGACVPAAAALLLTPDILLNAHGRDARYVENVSWKKDHFTRVLAAS